MLFFKLFVSTQFFQGSILCVFLTFLRHTINQFLICFASILAFLRLKRNIYLRGRTFSIKFLQSSVQSCYISYLVTAYYKLMRTCNHGYWLLDRQSVNENNFCDEYLGSAPLLFPAKHKRGEHLECTVLNGMELVNVLFTREHHCTHNF